MSKELRTNIDEIEPSGNDLINKELKAFNRIKNFQVVVDYEKDEVKTICELLPFSCKKVENALNDNYFYFYMVAKICKYLNIDINLHRDLIETENEILNTILKNENKLKALEIIANIAKHTFHFRLKERQNFGEDETSYYLIIDNCEYRLKDKEQYDLLKEVLL